MRRTNSEFHEWIFSEQQAFCYDYFIINGEEISEKLYVQMLCDEFILNVNQISKCNSSMILVGFAKISSVSSLRMGLTLGEIITSQIIEESISLEFLESHKMLYEKLWCENIKDGFVVESFRVYWDNFFMYAGKNSKSLLVNSNKIGNALKDLFCIFRQNKVYSSIIDYIWI